MMGTDDAVGDDGRPIGVVGLGRVGAPIAHWLLRKGRSVVVHRRGGSEALEAVGARRAGTVGAMLDECGIVMLALPSAAALRDVAAAAAIERVVRPSDPPVVIDLTTCDVATKVSAATAFAVGGAIMLDCPVSGMFHPDRDPPIDTMFASGPEAVLARVEWLLVEMVTNLRRVGAFGHGATVKLVANTLVAVHTAVAAEALALGVRSGLDPDLLVDVLTSSPATSWVLEDRALRMLRGPYEPPKASIDILLKDIGAIETLALSTGVKLPVLAAAREQFEEASRRGFGAEDVAGVYRVPATLQGPSD